MSNRAVHIDQFQFTGRGSVPGICSLEIIVLADDRYVVICSERADNTGPSITNAAEWIAAQVCVRHKIAPEQLVWIEHYPPSPTHGLNQDWDLVTFKLGCSLEGWKFLRPEWRTMRPADWAELGMEPRK